MTNRSYKRRKSTLTHNATSQRHLTARRSQPKTRPLAAIGTLSVWLGSHGHETIPSESDLQDLANNTGLTAKKVARCLDQIRTRYRRSLENCLISSSEDEVASQVDMEEHLHQIQPPIWDNALFDSVPPDGITNSFHIPSPGVAAADVYPEINLRFPSNDGFPVTDTGNSLAMASLDQYNHLDTTPDITQNYPLETWSQLGSPPPTQKDLISQLSAPIAPPTGTAPTLAVVETAPGPSGPQHSKPVDNTHKANKKTKLRFPCTFSGCHELLTQGAWKRHEESKHLPQRKWTCLLTGSEVNGRCAFCDYPHFTPESCPYYAKTSECEGRDSETRSFLRKDGFMQHVVHYHGVGQVRPEVVEAWEVPGVKKEQDWLCGFCGETLHGWDARAAHLAGHFREGLTLESWRGELESG